MSKEKKVKLQAAERLVLTAMPKGKKDAERVVDSLSEVLFTHVMLLAMYGDVRDTQHWMREIATFTSRMNVFASNTTNNHLNVNWMFTQLFTDYAKSPLHLASYMDLHSADKSYTPLSADFFQASPKIQSAVFDIVDKFYRDLCSALTDRDFIPQIRLYPSLKELVTRITEIHKQ